MNIEKYVAWAFRMDEAAWDRHAGPWSVWTRVATLPFLLLALWSHVWIGVAGAAAATAIVAIWIWLNPRLFPPPSHTDNWAAKGTFGERIWIERDRVAVPERHRVVPHVLTGVSAVGFVAAVWGAVANDGWTAVFGGAATVSAKLWFFDRMVWLFEDMRDTNPMYRGWLR